LLLVACFGCRHVSPPFVPVREAIYRTECSATNRLALPLSPADRDLLLLFLRSGRNPAMDRDAVIADAEAPSRYAGLLDLLARPDMLAVTDLVAEATFVPTPAFRPWFPEPAVRQVVDAHEDWPPLRPPYAFLDSARRNWWVFYHERKRLTHLMVTRALDSDKPK
jgi:hypothetical protein